MKTIHFAFGAIVLLVSFSSRAQTPVKLFENTCPTTQQSQQSIQTGIQAIQNAVTDGSRIHVSMVDQDGAHYFAEISGIRVVVNGPGSVYYASGVLPMRPYIDGAPNLVSKNGWFVGGVDTNGLYYWGGYLFGTDTWGTSTASSNAATQSGCFVTTWWAQ
ncbi:MAG: hypothetical protein HY749_17650 [Gammaproteobacteria bacterium]|nr:hypothetical protein [Gammaproteobacteria bacterium]MBI5616593.1 hypothetical protein [Gammaproteobacteria bacterium]